MATEINIDMDRPCSNCGMPAPGLRQWGIVGGMVLVVALAIAVVAFFSYVFEAASDVGPAHAETPADSQGKSKPKPPPEPLPRFPTYDR